MYRLALIALLVLQAAAACVEPAEDPPTEQLCGNGVVDGGEACDPAAGDAVDCLQDCTIEPCGNGVVDPGEDCDLSSGASVDCDRSCRFDRCGNKRLDPGEACDSGADGSKPCNPDCSISGCGDGQLGDDEECDPSIDPTCLAGCRLPQPPDCGDGVLDAGEACDEGPANGRAFSTCTIRCTVPSCGDGFVSIPSEQCEGVEGCAECRWTRCAAIAVAALGPLSLVALADGRLLATGDLFQAQFASFLPPDRAAGLVALPDAPPLVVLAGRFTAGAGLTADGRLFVFGSTSWGQRGDGSILPVDPPASLFSEPMPERRFVDVAATSRGLLALATDGAVWAFGGDAYGELGPAEGDRQSCTSGAESIPCRPLPTRVQLPEGFRPVLLFAGHDHAGAIDATGVTWLWGSNQWKALGTDVGDACPGAPAATCLPPVRVGQRVRAAAGSMQSSAFLSPDGRLWGFGGDRTFGLDPGTLDASRTEPTFHEAPDGARFTSIVAAGLHVVVLTEAGALYGAGEGGHGELGAGRGYEVQGLERYSPMGEGPFVAVSTADLHTLALGADGGVFAWGDARFQRLGAPDVGGGEPLPRSLALPVCP